MLLTSRKLAEVYADSISDASRGLLLRDLIRDKDRHHSTSKLEGPIKPRTKMQVLGAPALIRIPSTAAHPFVETAVLLTTACFPF